MLEAQAGTGTGIDIRSQPIFQKKKKKIEGGETEVGLLRNLFSNLTRLLPIVLEIRMPDYITNALEATLWYTLVHMSVLGCLPKHCM